MAETHRVIFHLDMDAFYASIEQRDCPEYRGRPVVVGALPSQRGVVCAASYEAREFGVRSAMPSVTAGRLCRHAVFVRPRMSVYREESRKIMKILESTGAIIEPMSIDEAYLDLSESVHGEDPDAALLNSLAMARRLKTKIRQERGLAASIGIASNKMLAKLASDYGKPDGLLLIPERDKVMFLRPLPVGRIHGVGRVTEETLKKAGLATIADLQDYRGDLSGLVGSWGESLKRFAFGEDDRGFRIDETAKSISSESTFATDTDERPILRRVLREQACELSAGLRKKRLRARTIQVKVRYSDFTTLTRQLSFDEPVVGESEIYRAACHLLARERLVHRPLRLLGLGVSRLVDWSWFQTEFPFATSGPNPSRST